ncbi:MAG: hypothetical protein Kow0068_00790 [Marinilabiliales bacterium]
MKAISWLLFLIFYSLFIQAQISYQASDFADAGDTVHISTSSTGLNGFDFEQTGTNYTWDYGNLPYSTQEDLKWEDPLNAGYKMVWCYENGIYINCDNQFANFTNMAILSRDSFQISGFAVENTMEHYHKTTNTLEYKMLGMTFDINGFPIPKIAEINNIDTVYNFPINYNDMDSSECNYTLKILGDSIKYSSSYKRINHVEGWGTLITPYDTFVNVLKMKTMLYMRDSFYYSGTVYGWNDTIVEYKWFDAGYKFPVLQADGRKVGPIITINRVSFIDSLRCIAPNALFYFSPPVVYWDNQITGAEVQFSNISTNIDSCYWDFDDGTTSNSYSPVHIFNCPGTYQVDLHVTNKVCNPYRFDSITIPVSVIDTGNYFNTVDTININNGDSVFVNGNWYSGNQVIIDTLASVYGCDSIATTVIVVNSGIADNPLVNNYKIYPNPTKGKIFIDTDEIITVQLYDATNRLIITTRNKELNINTCPSGVYYIKLISEKFIDTIKIIKI